MRFTLRTLLLTLFITALLAAFFREGQLRRQSDEKLQQISAELATYEKYDAIQMLRSFGAEFANREVYIGKDWKGQPEDLALLAKVPWVTTVTCHGGKI